MHVCLFDGYKYMINNIPQTIEKPPEFTQLAKLIVFECVSVCSVCSVGIIKLRREFPNQSF